MKCARSADHHQPLVLPPKNMSSTQPLLTSGHLREQVAIAQQHPDRPVICRNPFDLQLARIGGNSYFQIQTSTSMPALPDSSFRTARSLETSLQDTKVGKWPTWVSSLSLMAFPSQCIIRRANFPCTMVGKRLYFAAR